MTAVSIPRLLISADAERRKDEAEEEYAQKAHGRFAELSTPLI